jgi:hypothetical protein
MILHDIVEGKIPQQQEASTVIGGNWISLPVANLYKYTSYINSSDLNEPRN